MSLAAGTRLGPYEVQSPIGAGGMGEVYKARDTRLDRMVAVKVLPTHLSSDIDLKQRFEREARAISTLSHPNICHLYDVGSQNGVDYLVMEYLEGQTLAERLNRGPLPLEQLLRIGIEIADGLDKAHKHGIVHRDLKPANIMLSTTGTKLMDFGLARPGGIVGDSTNPALPTMPQTMPLTARGTIVGTLQYMSPEQIEGKQADTRSDIFAFGAVLYEMASGKAPFAGGSPASIIAAVLASEPPSMTSLQPSHPPALDHVIQTALVKNPDDRWQSVRDMKLQLQWIGSHAAELREGQPQSISRVRRFAPWFAALLLLAIVCLLVVRDLRHVAPMAQLTRLSVLPPPNTSFVAQNFAISPDGRRLAFVALAEDGRTTLWVRSLNAATSQQLAGTEGARYPFWSPDSGSIGFFAEGKLKKVEVSGGALRAVCDAPVGVGGTWGQDDTIVFAPSVVGPLQRVSAAGGSPTTVTMLAREGSGQAHRWPSFLPDGKHFLYFVDWSSPADPQGDGIYVGSLESPETKLISAEIIGNVEYASGHLVFVQNRSLVAQPFDLKRLQFSSAPKRLTEQELRHEVAASHASFSTAANGLTVFESTSDAASQLVWLDVSGKEIGRIPGSGYTDPHISPDGRYLAISYDPQHNGIYAIHVYDLVRGTKTRLTEGRGEQFPVWSADGKKVFYVASTAKTYYLSEIAADGSGTSRVLLEGAKMIPNGTSPDGKYLVYMDFEKGFPLLAMYSTADGSHRPLVQAGVEAQISPNGRWIVHLGGGRESGEVFVQPFPDPGPRIQISTNTGAQPRWRGDGRQLYYIGPDRKLMAVDFDPTGKTAPSAPRALFQTRIVQPKFALFQYDVTPDGKRFIVNSLPPAGTVPLTLIENWTSQQNK